MTDKRKIAKLVSTLNEALGWCRIDAKNEDSYPTQEMFDARVEVIERVLGKDASKEEDDGE